MTKYRKKPIEVEAVQWTGENHASVESFLGNALDHFIQGEAWVLDDGELWPVVESEWLVKDRYQGLMTLTDDDFRATHEVIE